MILNDNQKANLFPLLRPHPKCTCQGDTQLPIVGIVMHRQGNMNCAATRRQKKWRLTASPAGVTRVTLNWDFTRFLPHREKTGAKADADASKDSNMIRLISNIRYLTSDLKQYDTMWGVVPYLDFRHKVQLANNVGKVIPTCRLFFLS